MGYDVSYHPISPEQMRHWYVASLASDAHAADVCDAAELPELYRQKFLEFLPEFRANSAAPGAIFDKTHAFFLAVTQGFFGKYHYLRGAMLSELGKTITPYTAPWADVLPELVGEMVCHNRITENYSGGVYLPPAQVVQLMADTQTNPALRSALDAVFPGEHLNVLFIALQDAKSQGVGLLEATDMIEPNPLDLQATHCLSNLFNCDTTGPILYQRTAEAQIAAMGLADDLSLESLERVHVTTNPETGEVSASPAPAPTGPGDHGEAVASAQTDASEEASATGFRARFRRAD